MTLSKSITAFLDECKMRNLSENTLRRYETALWKFYDFLVEEGAQRNVETEIYDINPFFVKSFMSSINGLKPATRKNYLDIIKKYIRFLNNEIDGFYCDLDKLNLKIKMPKPLKETLSKDEIEKIEKHLSEKFFNTNSYNIKSQSLLIKFLIKTGARAGEGINMLFENLSVVEDKEGREFFAFKIEGKGKKERVVYILKDSFEELDVFLKDRPRFKYLFSKKNGEKLNYFGVKSFNDNMLKKLGIKHKGLHIYRHTFATMKIKEGFDISLISEYLGHFDIKVTHDFYVKTDEYDKMKVGGNVTL